jgi:hypothetical protein
MARTRAAARRKDSADTPTPRKVIGLKKIDGWENALTGLGTARDKRTAGRVAYTRLSWVECEELWRGDDMAAKVVEEPAREMTRRWLDVQIENEAEDEISETKADAELVEKDLKRLKAQGRVREAIMRQRAYGGAILLVGADDGVSDISLPLREASLKRIRFLTVFDAWEACPRTYYQDPGDEGYGEPETYWIYPQGIPGGLQMRVTPTAGTTIVHESRVLRFEGVRVSRRQERENRGWPDSVFVRMIEVLKDFGIAYGGAAHLTQDFGQAVLKMRGLYEALAAGNEKLVRARLEMIDESRSLLRALLLDAGDGAGGPVEDFERKTTPVTGLPELLDRMANRLAAAADMPVTRLMGQSPAGLNATGKQDANWWMDRMAGQQDEVMRDPLERLVHLLFLAKEGPTKGVVPENWSLVWRPLTQLSPDEEAGRRLKVAQADAAWIGAQVIMPEEAAVSHFGGDQFDAEIHIDKELRKAMADNTAAGIENEAESLDDPAPGEPGGPPKPPPVVGVPGGGPPPPGAPPAGAKPPGAPPDPPAGAKPKAPKPGEKPKGGAPP